MTNAPHASSSALDPRIAAARDARLAYEDALTTDGTSASTWRALARQLTITANGMEDAGMLAGFVQCHRDRAADADAKADFLECMVVAAHRYGRVIDMATIEGAS